MEQELIGAITGISIALAASLGLLAKVKRRFSQVLDLLNTLDAAWKDDKIDENEWNAIWDKLMRIISNAPPKDVKE